MAKFELGLVLAIAIPFSGCRGSGDADAAGVRGFAAGPEVTASVVAPQTLTATVRFTGKPPAPEPIARGADPFCAKTEANSEEVLVKDGRLANVMVRVVAGAKGSYPPPEAEHLIEQRDCMYRPRVSGLVAGQTLAIRNADGTMHNVHTYAGDDETIFNVAQPTQGTIRKSANDLGGVTNGPITFECDVHPWMSGYVVVNPNPYFAVTAADGTATIRLPPGHYTLEAWHERFGTKTAEVEIVTVPATVEFSYSGTEGSGS